MSDYIDGYLIQKDKTSEYIILILVIALIVISWSIILYFATKYNSYNTRAYETCQKTFCPTNRFSGQKRCPENPNIPLQYDPIIEVCNPSNACTDDSTPYAIQSDGSTSLSGICDIDGCRCVNYFTTPSYTQVLFNMVNGSIFSADPTSQSRTVFQQQVTPYVGEGNNVPIVYTDPTTQFFEISPTFLYIISPTSCTTIFNNTSDADPQPTNLQILQCINSNPCLSGRMAYIPSDTVSFADFDSDDISGGVGLACVPNTVENSPNNDNSCYTQSGVLYAPVFNSINGKIYCYETNVNNTT